MKATAKDRDFVPCSITITFESKRELDVFATAMNCSPICDMIETLGGFDPAIIREVLEQLGADQTNQINEMVGLLAHHPCVKHVTALLS